MKKEKKDKKFVRSVDKKFITCLFCGQPVQNLEKKVEYHLKTCTKIKLIGSNEN